MSDRRLTPEAILQKPYSRVLIPEDCGGYSAQLLEFPGCWGEGITIGEALANLEQAARAWLEEALSKELPIPKPRKSRNGSGTN
jgi:predicted RNase H-like HicB family nuclease